MLLFIFQFIFFGQIEYVMPPRGDSDDSDAGE